MRTRRLMILAVSAMLPATQSFAQNNTPPAHTMEQPAAAPHSSGSGTAPEGKGSTGWTGGTRDQNPQTTGQGAAQDAEAAKDQPAVATGEDLKGPPTQFAPSKTPE